MPPKAPVITALTIAITLGLEDISITDIDS